MGRGWANICDIIITVIRERPSRFTYTVVGYMVRLAWPDVHSPCLNVQETH